MSQLINFLNNIQQKGLKIQTVYDIGAYTGGWSRETKTLAIPNAEFILFEANPAYKNALEHSGFSHFCGIALSNPGRETVEFYNGTNTGDSYYKETTTIYDNQSTISLDCFTLDELVSANNLPIPDFIKIDTQGSELDILSGADSFIDQVNLIYTECPILCYNKGAPTIQDYIEYFKSKRFIPIDIFEIHKGEDTLIQVDIMFMKQSVKEQFLSPNKLIRPFA